LDYIVKVLIIISVYLVVVGQPSDAVVYIAVALFNSLIGLCSRALFKDQTRKLYLAAQ
jgi:hypothetical protein